MKRGQLSLFLIVAAVLVVIAGVTVYIFKQQDNTIVEGGTLDEQQVRGFVRSCLKESAFLSLEAVGRGGGYADPAASGFAASPIAPTETTAMQSFNGEPPLPYWSYLESKNTCTRCTHASEQLPLTGEGRTVQSEVETDLTPRFVACINEFKGLQGITVTPLADPVVTVQFGERDVTVFATYPLQIEGQGSVETSQFQEVVDVPLQKLYRVAYDIRDQADNTHYFEGLALEAITYAAQGDAIPPPAGSLDVGYDPGPIWVLTLTREKVADAISASVGHVQLFQSRNMDFVRTGDSVTDRMYANYYFSIGEDVSAIDATFTYLPQWTPYLKISPGGEIIRPQLYPRFPLFPQFKRKDFQYDLSFPVLVQLHADTSRGRYLFQFPLEANMRGNRPVSFDQSSADNENELNICRPEVAVGSKATVTITEGNSGLPINAVVRYSCVDDQCLYGESVDGTVTQQLPPCVGGELSAEREGYRTARVNLDSVSDETKQVAFSLVRLQPITVKVAAYETRRLRDLDGKPWTLATTPIELDPQFRTVLVFTPIDDESYTQVAVVPPGEDQSATIDLAPGQYSVVATVMQTLAQPHVVVGAEYCDGGFIGTGIGENCERADDIVLGDPITVTLEDGTVVETNGGEAYVGGIMFESPARPAEFTQSQIDSGVITVPVVVVPLEELQMTDDIEVIGKFEELGASLTIT